MLLSSFDFSNLKPIEKLLAINLPVVFAECLTYPLLRIQSLIFTCKPTFTLSPIRQVQFYMRTMQKQEKFPRFMAGLRYSIDHSATYTTARFLIFEYIMGKVQELSKLVLYGCVLGATALGTVISQPAFNYRTVVSELPVNKYRHEEIKNRFIQLDKIKILKAGLWQSVLINCLLASGELFLFSTIRNTYPQYLDSDFIQLVPALLINLSLTLLLHPLHRHRIISIHNQFSHIQLPNPLLSFQGIWTSIFRRTTYTTLVFGFYTMFMNWQMRKEVEWSRGEKRIMHQNVQRYREGMSQQEGEREMQERKKMDQEIKKNKKE